VADPIVLHDNTDPTGEFPQNVALHAGFNDTHELKVEGPNLVGQPTEITGPAKNVPLVLPLHFDELGRLTIDLGDLTDGLAAAQSTIAALQGQLTADTAIINALQAAAVVDEGNITTLQGQVATLQAQVVLLLQTAVTIPVMKALFAGVGSLTATLRSISHFDNLLFSGTGKLTVNEMLVRPITASFAGAGGLTAFFSGPRSLGNLLFVGNGALTADLRIYKDIRTILQGAGGMQANAGLLMPAVAAMVGTGSLTASLFPALFLPATVLSASGSLTASLAKLLPVTTFAGQGTLGDVTAQLQLGMTPAAFAGAGNVDNANAQVLVSARTGLVGVGGFSVGTNQWFAANALLAGSGRLLADLLQKSPFLVALLAGQGGQTVNLNTGLAILSSLAGAGGQTVNLSNGLAILGNLAGAGAMSPVQLNQLEQIVATLPGAGGMTVTDLQKLLGPALFAGAGGYNGKLAQRLAISRVMAGTGALTANVTQQSSFSAFDPANSDVADLTLSNNNRTVTAKSLSYYANARGTKSQSSGKKYFEVKVTQTDINTGGGTTLAVGLVNSTFSMTLNNVSIGAGDATNNSTAACLFSNTSASAYILYNSAAFVASITASGAAVNDVIGIAASFGAGIVSIAVAVNGMWANNGLASSTLTAFDMTNWAPASGMPLYPAVSVTQFVSQGQLVLNVGNAAFAYTMPAGYTAWG
jgi:hypothetical protein